MECPFYNSCNHVDCDAEFCIKRFRLSNLYSNALLTEKLVIDTKLIPQTQNDKIAFDKLKDIKLDIENFVSSGSNLYIYSNMCGNGKTSWAVKLMKEYMNKVWFKTNKECVALFIHVPSLLLEIKNFSEKVPSVKYIKENVIKADVVVWDELGTKFATDFEKEQLLEMINGRCISNKSNIYTSNILPDMQQQLLGDRLYSRTVLSCGNNIIGFESGDMRRVVCETPITN